MTTIVSLHMTNPFCRPAVTAHAPDNNNALTLSVGSVELTMFGLHPEITELLQKHYGTKSITEQAEEIGLNDIVARHAGRISQEICGQ